MDKTEKKVDMRTKDGKAEASRIAELEAKIARMEEDQRKKSSLQGGKPVVIDSKNKRLRNASQQELGQMLQFGDVKDALVKLFLLAPKSYKWTKKSSISKAMNDLVECMLPKMRGSGVDFQLSCINVIGRDSIINTPNDLIQVSFSAPIVVKSPVKNDPPLSHPGDKFFLHFRFNAHMVLDESEFASYFKKLER